MSRYPAAIWKPITAKKRAAMTWFRRVNLHVAVSEASSLHGYFNRRGIPDSHFYVRRDGTVEQYVDTDLQAYADLDGNDATISIETQGGLTNVNGEGWTAAQLETLARLYAWCVRVHDVPLRIATDAKIASSSHGLSWHRLGIDGTFPALPDVRAGRLQRGGGMHYSASAGKVCPGDAKIRQIPTIYARAVALLREDDAPTPTPERDEDNMPALNEKITLEKSTAGPLGRDEITYGGAVQYAAAGGFQALKRLPRIEATLKAQSAALLALSQSVGVDPDEIERIVGRAVEKSLEDIEITLTTATEA